MRVTHKAAMLGSRHDPYAADVFEITLDDGASATYYSDGLGQHMVALYDTEFNLIRELRWYGPSNAPHDLNTETKARILYRRHVGRTLDSVIDEAWH